MATKFDAYEQDEYNTNRRVYVNLKNGNHIICVVSQIMNQDYTINEKFKYNKDLGVFEEQ